MSTITPALQVLDKFISVASELAKLPALVLPQYQSAAQDLYEICKKLLLSNENVSRWLYRFLYFDFRQDNSSGMFSTAVQEYKTMKSGPEFQQLKFSCSDIGQIYYRDIESKLGNWFASQQKLEEAEGIFAALTDADREMVTFIYDDVIAKVDDFVSEVEKHVEGGALDDAEQARLKFKATSREVTERLEKFSNDLSDLVIHFAGIARIPVTLAAS